MERREYKLIHLRPIIESHKNESIDMQCTEAVLRRCSVKKIFLKIHSKTPAPKSFLKKFWKFLRTPFVIEHLW